jgi:DNA-binding NarL/FixJ family response regulator
LDTIKQEHRELVEQLRPSRRVLIVDDHPGFRKCAGALLAAEGFEVVGAAENGEAAIALVAELAPELVLLDIQLPDLDGFEVAERLLARDPELKIVLVSSRDRSAYGSAIETSGAVGFIWKAELSGGAIEEALA